MIRRFKTIFILFLLTVHSNCYFNPLIQKFVFTEPKKENSILSSLSLLSLSPSPFAISLTGQIRNENGSTVTNVLLTVTSRTNELEGLDATATTDEGGRFYIRLASGTTTFAVTQEGSPYFTFKLQINSPTDIRVVEISDNSFPVEVGSFVTFEPGNQPSFFELLSSNPFQNEDRANTPEGFEFYFTEDVAGPIQGQDAQWLSENLTVVPNLTFGPVSMSTSSFYVQTFNFTNETTYQITLTSNLRSSVSGIPLIPRTITFRCISQCGL